MMNRAAILLVALAAFLVGAPAVATAVGRPLPPAGIDWDYQLGGAHPVPASVTTVVRDRKERPLAGGYNICYVNGFQTQPDERGFWRSSARRWRLVLHQGGRPVVDSAWGEWLLDIRTAAGRERLAAIVGRWIERCAADGFDAVELDNLDSFARSRGLIARQDARRFARLLTARAHDAGLAVGQKNWVELGDRGPRDGFDFAITEECGRWRECAGFVAAYGAHVLVVEYRRSDFDWSCEHFGSLPVVLRDRGLRADGRRAWC
jgi:hypothetical protein